MKKNILCKLDECYNVLLRLYDSLPDKEKYALPYLISPSTTFLDCDCKILIAGRETYGWGNKEILEENWRRENYKSNLIKLYEDKVNTQWGKGTGSTFWGFVRKFKNQIDNYISSHNSSQPGYKVGIVVANTSLIGYEYGTKGFNPDLIHEGKDSGLERAFDLLVAALQPNIIILTIGGNLSNGYVNNYLRIIQSPLKLDMNNISSIVLTPKEAKRKILVNIIRSCLPSSPLVYITSHPRGIHYDFLLNYIFKNLSIYY